jgi:hypothetical protein
VDYRPTSIGHWYFNDNENHDFCMYAKVLDVEAFPSTSDPRGMVSGGRVTLKGRVVPLKVTFPEDINEQGEHGHEPSYSFNFTHTRSLPASISVHIDVPLRSETEQVRSGDELCYFEIVSPRPLGRKTLCGAGLILRPAKESVDAVSLRSCKAESHPLAVFRRVGYGSLQPSDEDHVDLNIDRRDYYIGCVTII